LRIGILFVAGIHIVKIKMEAGEAAIDVLVRKVHAMIVVPEGAKGFARPPPARTMGK
jgi:hypothetical protein